MTDDGERSMRGNQEMGMDGNSREDHAAGRGLIRACEADSLRSLSDYPSVRVDMVRKSWNTLEVIVREWAEMLRGLREARNATEAA